MNNKQGNNLKRAQEKLYCDCNKWLGGVNLVTGQNASWVLEQRKDSLIIYRYINDKEPKELPALEDVNTGKVTGEIL